MNEEQKFSIALWSLGAAVVITSIMAIALTNINYVSKLSKSSDPFAFACAYNSSNTALNGECAIYLTKRN